MKRQIFLEAWKYKGEWISLGIENIWVNIQEYGLFKAVIINITRIMFCL